MSFRNQTRRWNRQMLSWISPKQLALLLLGTAILSFGMHNIHRRVDITEGGVLGMVLLLDHQLSLPPWLMTAGFGYHLLFAGPALSGMGFHQAFRSGLFGNVHFFPAMGAVCANAAGSFGISVGSGFAGRPFCGNRCRTSGPPRRVQRRRRRAGTGDFQAKPVPAVQSVFGNGPVGTAAFFDLYPVSADCLFSGDGNGLFPAD